MPTGLDGGIACGPLSEGKGRHQEQGVLSEFSRLPANQDTLSYWKSPQLQAMSPVHRQDCQCRHREPERVSAEHPTGGEGCIAATPEAERTHSCSSVATAADLTAAVSR